MRRSEIDAITVAYLNGDIGEALRLVGEATERDRAELDACPGYDAERRSQLERDLRFLEGTKARLLI
jgi:hypothetical protein